jgi:hypothetical protein
VNKGKELSSWAWKRQLIFGINFCETKQGDLKISRFGMLIRLIIT